MNTEMVFDTLQKVSGEPGGMSLWRGEHGQYAIKAIPGATGRAPFAKMYLNRKYFTGLFRTEQPTTFSGDILDAITGEKNYLLAEMTPDRSAMVLRKKPRQKRKQSGKDKLAKIAAQVEKAQATDRLIAEAEILMQGIPPEARAAILKALEGAGAEIEKQ